MPPDGVSNINSGRTIPEAQAAHRDGIHIYAIGIGLSDTRELDSIATPPARDNSFVVNDFDELSFLHQVIFASICPGEQLVQVQCCIMTTEAIRTIRDREPRMATSTFTQLLSSVSR